MSNFDFVKDEVKKAFDFFKNESKVNNFIIAGGCFASLYHEREVKDYDVFILSDFYFEAIENLIKNGGKIEKIRKKSITINHIYIYDIVSCICPDATIIDFDFEHSKSSYNGETFEIKEHLIANKILEFNPLQDELSPYDGSSKARGTLTRLKKHISKGWVINV